MENIFLELKKLKVNHVIYGKGIINNIEFKEYEKNFDVICSIKFENDLKEYRIFKLMASNLESKLIDNDIKKYINYLNELNENKEKEYLEIERNEILKNKEVDQLVHFTKAENLLSILNNGLLSVNKLVNKNIPFYGADENRLDNQLDYICTSISFPNYKMFYRKRNEYKTDIWIILKINPKILIDKIDTLFLPTNSADKIMQIELLQNKNYYNTNKALEDLFSDKVKYRGDIKYRQESLIKRNMTTNPQAEILIRDSIEIKYIKSIVVQNEEIKKYIAKKIEDKSIPIEIDSKLFGYREDFEVWRNEYDCETYIY